MACFGVTRTVVPRGADVKDVLAELGLKYDDTWKPTGRMGKRLSALLMSPSCVCRFLMLPVALGTADALKIARSEEAHLEDNLARVLTRGVFDPAAAASDLTLDAVKALVAAAYLGSLGVSTVGHWNARCGSGDLNALAAEVPDLVKHVVSGCRGAGYKDVVDPRAAAAAAGGAGAEGMRCVFVGVLEVFEVVLHVACCVVGSASGKGVTLTDSQKAALKAFCGATGAVTRKPCKAPSSQQSYREIFQRAGFTVVGNPGAGNCLFHAIAELLFRDASLHGTVREAICAHMQSEPIWFADALLGGEDESVDQHVARMSVPGAEGELVDLFYASLFYRRSVVYYQAHEVETAGSVAGQAHCIEYAGTALGEPMHLVWNMHSRHWEAVKQGA